MSYLLIRHFLVTVFIIGLIYVPLLWVNNILPVAYLANANDHTSIPDVSAVQEKKKKKTHKKQQKKQKSAAPVENKISEFSITGISMKVKLNSSNITQQVESIWQRFSDNDALHESVGWIKGSNAVYAYYHSFNSSFTSAILTVGYESGSTVKGLSPVIVKSGIYKTFAFNSYGISPDEAWEYAYPKATILERYKVDINGKTHYKDVLVIHPKKKK